MRSVTCRTVQKFGMLWNCFQTTTSGEGLKRLFDFGQQLHWDISSDCYMKNCHWVSGMMGAASFAWIARLLQCALSESQTVENLGCPPKCWAKKSCLVSSTASKCIVPMQHTSCVDTQLQYLLHMYICLVHPVSLPQGRWLWTIALCVHFFDGRKICCQLGPLRPCASKHAVLKIVKLIWCRSHWWVPQIVTTQGAVSPVFPQLGFEPNHTGLTAQSFFFLEESCRVKRSDTQTFSNFSNYSKRVRSFQKRPPDFSK